MNRIYADFMKNDSQNRLVLTCRGTFEDLAKFNMTFEPGLRVVFYNENETNEGVRDDLVVEGIVAYDSEKGRWVAAIDWDAIKNISQLSAEEKDRLGIDKNG